MITVIGQNGCGNCFRAKQILTQKNINFEYKILNDLSEEEQNKYQDMAREKGMQHLPIIIMNNEVVTLEDIIH